MATWRAQCWLGSEVGYQDLEVQANTIQGAKSQLERIYGAEQIIGLHEVYDDSDTGSSIDGSGVLGILAIIILVVAWKYILVLGIIGLAIWYFMFYNK